MIRIRLAVLAAALFAVAAPVSAPAQEVWITKDVPFFEYSLNGQTYTIERNQDQNATLQGSFAKTSRKCPPFCVHPMSAAPGVLTVGELELLQFMRSFAEPGLGILVDARLGEWYQKGTIPGAVNVPFNLFNPKNNPFFEPIIGQLGARKSGNTWDFSNAKRLLLFCNGPWCDQSPRAIRNLISVGYPADRLYYYRGGMQSWQSMGFPTVKPAGS